MCARSELQLLVSALCNFFFSRSCIPLINFHLSAPRPPPPYLHLRLSLAWLRKSWSILSNILRCRWLPPPSRDAAWRGVALERPADCCGLCPGRALDLFFISTALLPSSLSSPSYSSGCPSHHLAPILMALSLPPSILLLLRHEFAVCLSEAEFD